MSHPAYTDENGVMLNKLGITDAQQLRSAEYEITSQRSAEILEGNALTDITGYGFERHKAIHKHLFGNVYEWAGKPRNVPSAKRMDNGMLSVFASPDDIQKDWERLSEKTHAFAEAKGLSFQKKTEALAEVFIEANRIHAFPEGNGRSLQIFMHQLAAEQGVELDYDKVDKQAWNRASGLSCTHGKMFERVHFIPAVTNPAPIKEIFRDMAKPIEQEKYLFPTPSEREIQAIFEKEVVSDFFDGVLSVQNGQAQVALVGGQPGAGKTNTCTRIKNEMQEQSGVKAVFLDVDSMRAYHPEFNSINQSNDKESGYHTNEFANKLFEMAIRHSIENRFNIVIEGTFKRPERVAAQAEMFRNNGYTVKAEVVSTPYAISKLSTQLRYEKPKANGGYGRAVPTETHDSAYRGCPETLQHLQEKKLVDAITISRRDGIPVYNNQLNNGEWTNKESAASTLSMDRERALTRDEGLQLLGDISKLHQMLGRSGRNPQPSDLLSAQTHTYLCDELLRKSGMSTYHDKSPNRDTPQGVLNELAASAATHSKPGEVYEALLKQMDAKGAAPLAQEQNKAQEQPRKVLRQTSKKEELER